MLSIVNCSKATIALGIFKSQRAVKTQPSDNIINYIIQNYLCLILNNSQQKPTPL